MQLLDLGEQHALLLLGLLEHRLVVVDQVVVLFLLDVVLFLEQVLVLMQFVELERQVVDVPVFLLDLAAQEGVVVLHRCVLLFQIVQFDLSLVLVVGELGLQRVQLRALFVVLIAASLELLLPEFALHAVQLLLLFEQIAQTLVVHLAAVRILLQLIQFDLQFAIAGDQLDGLLVLALDQLVQVGELLLARAELELHVLQLDVQAVLLVIRVALLSTRFVEIVL